jgi:tight adherence protein B
MPTSTLVVLIIGALAVLIFLAGIITSFRSRGTTQEGSGETTEVAQVETPADAASELKDFTLLDRINERMVASEWGAGIAQSLARADLKMRPGEYVGLTILAVLIGAILTSLIGGFVWHVALAGGVLGGLIPGMYLRRTQTKRQGKFNNQLPDMLNLMVNGLRAGNSNLQAMESISREMPSPIADEFHRVVQEVQLGLSLNRALENLTKRVPSDDLDLIVTAMNVHHEVGGNLSEILDTISYTIRDRVRIQGELRVLTSQAMFSGQFLSLMPIALLFGLYLIDRNYILEFFKPENVPCGYFTLGTAGLMIIFGYLAMKKLAKVEV